MGKRYANANNKYTNNDPMIEITYLYVDVNNSYRCCMTEPLPTGENMYLVNKISDQYDFE